MVLAMNLTEGRSDDVGVRIETRTWDATREQAEQYGLVFGGAYVVLTLRAMLNVDMHDGESVDRRAELLGQEEIGETGFGLGSVLETLGELQGYLFVSRDTVGASVFEVVIPLRDAMETLQAVQIDAVLTGAQQESLMDKVKECGAEEYLQKGAIDGARLLYAIQQGVERHHREDPAILSPSHDSLTGLANRRALMERLAKMVTHAREAVQPFLSSAWGSIISR